MKAIYYHIRGIVTSFEQLLKGKYLIYFVPGLLLTGLFWYFRSRTLELDESIDLTSQYSWLSWVDSGVSTVFGIIDFILEQLYIFIVLTALSPFFTALGEKFDKDLTGHKTEGGVLRFINDMIRMVFVVILSLFLEFLFMVAYWLVSKIFGFPEIVNTIVYYGIGAFFFGFAFYDFALERYEKSVLSSLGFAFSAPLGMIILGSIFKGIYAIPIVGVPLSPVIVVMISTVAYAYYTKRLPPSKQLSNA